MGSVGKGLAAAAVRRARAAAQLLVSSRATSIAGVLAATCGIQAQDLAAAAMSIRPRAPGLGIGDVFAAAGGGAMVLTWTMRGTRHLHPAGDIPWLLSVFAPVFGRQPRREAQLGIGGVVGDRAVAALAQALAERGPLTRAEVKEVLAPLGIDVSGQAPVHVLYRAALAGVLVVLPDPHGAERYILLDDWVHQDPGPPLPADEGLALLARRYLAAFGPATLQDFRAWSGLPARLATQGWAGMASQSTDVGGGRWVLTSDLEQARSAANTPAPLRLLGAFDTLLLGYKDRSLVLAPEHARRVNAGGGMVAPVVLDDGEVVGTWRYLRPAQGPHRIQVTPFRPIDPEELAREAAAIGRFLGTNVVVA